VRTAHHHAPRPQPELPLLQCPRDGRSPRGAHRPRPAIRYLLCAMTSPERSPVLVAEGLTRVFGEGEAAVQALRGVDLTLYAGRIRGAPGRVGVGQVAPC
jgi:hypothetical protein